MLFLFPSLRLSNISSLKRVYSVKSQSSTSFTNSLAFRLLRPSSSYIRLCVLNSPVITTLP